jgi:hypothetical protein
LSLDFSEGNFIGMDTTLVTQEASLPIPNSTEAAGPLARVLAKLFSRHFLNAAILLVVPLIFAQPLRQPIELLRDPDVWWHLADARILCTTHHFIHVEPYSFTVSGQRWVNPEWLSEIPYWLGYAAFHWSGVYLVTWLALVANLMFLYWRGYWKTGHAGAAFWAACLGFALMTVNSGPRTILFAYLALSAELAILEAIERGKARLAWLLPPLFCIWINLHGSWVIGIGLLVLYVVCGAFGVSKGVFEQTARSSKDQKRLVYALFASLMALLLNPYGWRLIWNPFDMMLNQKLNIANAEEWQPLHLDWFVGKAALAAILLMVLANFLRGRKWRLYEIVFIIFAWYAAFDHVRFAFLAAVIITPFLAADMVRGFCAHANAKTIPVMNALAGVCALWMMVHIIPSDAELQNDVARLFPRQTIASLDPSWRTFNSANLGGVMAFDSKSSYIDSRLDTFEHHGVLKDYLEAMRIQQPLEVLDRYGIDHVLFPEHTPLAYLLERMPGWRVEKREGEGSDFYILLERIRN